jgi:L-amino acid N-acyltransferase YncA
MMIRMATAHDLPAIVRCGREMHDTTDYALLDFDPDRVVQTFTELMAQSQFVAVAENINGDVVGGMAGRCFQSWFGKDMIAADIALFVHSDARGGIMAVQLIKAFTVWAKLAGARQVRPGVATGDERAEGLYAHLGFRRCGSHFCMDIEQGADHGR